MHRPILTVYLYGHVTAGLDYTPVSRGLTFNAAVTTQMVEVPILDDHIVEHSEIINLTLVSTDSAVILNPSTSTITIQDVDSKLLHVDDSIYSSMRVTYSHSPLPVTSMYYVLLYICDHECNKFTFSILVVTIGFSRTGYYVSEDAGSVNVTVSVQSGTLDRDVIVNLSTINGTALCEFQFETIETYYRKSHFFVL